MQALAMAREAPVADSSSRCPVRWLPSRRADLFLPRPICPPHWSMQPCADSRAWFGQKRPQSEPEQPYQGLQWIPRELVRKFCVIGGCVLDREGVSCDLALDLASRSAGLTQCSPSLRPRVIGWRGWASTRGGHGSWPVYIVVLSSYGTTAWALSSTASTSMMAPFAVSTSTSRSPCLFLEVRHCVPTFPFSSSYELPQLEVELQWFMFISWFLVLFG